MRFLLVSVLLVTVTGCGTVPKKGPTVIENDPISDLPKEINETNPTIVMSEIPEGAISGIFNSDAEPFYAAVDSVDTENQTTTISFENEAMNGITLPEAIGASLSSVRFEGFDRDILMINSIYKDPIFRKYYLYILKNDQWHPVVDGFILHVDNISNDMIPIQPDPRNSNRMVRSYSVFDMDPDSETKYNWILKEETAEIMNR